MEEFIERMRENFSLRYFNLVIGLIFAATSLVGTILVYFQGFLHILPTWAFLLIAVVLILTGVIVSKKNSDSSVIQVASYGIAVAPLGVLFAAFLGKVFADVSWKTYSAREISRLQELGKLGANDPRPSMTYGLVDVVLAAGYICTISLVVLTILSCILPKWLIRPKTAGILAIIAYILALVFVAAIFNGRIINGWVILFSILPFALVVSAWVFQTGLPITFSSACSAPISSFTSIVDWAQSVND